MRKLLFIFLAISFPVFALETTGSGIIYGKDNAYFLKAPKNWVLDNSSGVSQGLNAVFYPKGGSWKDSDCVMYSRAFTKNKTINELIDADVADFKAKRTNLQVTSEPDLKTEDNKTALIKQFISKEDKYYELVAYIAEQKTVSMVILSCKTDAEFNKSIATFNEVVHSYRFTAIKINTMDNK